MGQAGRERASQDGKEFPVPIKWGFLRIIQKVETLATDAEKIWRNISNVRILPCRTFAFPDKKGYSVSA